MMGGFIPMPSRKMQDALDTRVKALEAKMAKRRVVQFKKGDGLKPGRSEEPGRPFLLKTPVDITIRPQQVQAVRLGLSCNLPVLVTRGADAKVFAPGQELEVTIEGAGRKGPSDEILEFGVGETVARCFVLDCTDLELDD